MAAWLLSFLRSTAVLLMLCPSTSTLVLISLTSEGWQSESTPPGVNSMATRLKFRTRRSWTTKPTSGLFIQVIQGYFLKMPSEECSRYIINDARSLYEVNSCEYPVLPPDCFLLDSRFPGALVTSTTKGGRRLFSSLCFCLLVNRISQKVVDGYCRYLVDSLGTWHGRND